MLRPYCTAQPDFSALWYVLPYDIFFPDASHRELWSGQQHCSRLAVVAVDYTCDRCNFPAGGSVSPSRRPRGVFGLNRTTTSQLRPPELGKVVRFSFFQCLAVFYHAEVASPQQYRGRDCNTPKIPRPATTEELALSFVYSNVVGARRLLCLLPNGDRTLESCSSVDVLQI